MAKYREYMFVNEIVLEPVRFFTPPPHFTGGVGGWGSHFENDSF